MQNYGAEIDLESSPVEKPSLEYATRPRGRPHSAWSIVGFALAWAFLLQPFMIIGFFLKMWWFEYGFNIQIGFGREQYLLMLVPICLCLIGLRRGRKGFAIAGIAISVFGLLVMFVAQAGSPWG